MFTLQQIKDAHSKVKTGADFPRYVQDIKALGVTGYTTWVSDMHTDYTGAGDYKISSEPKFAATEIAENSDGDKFRQSLKVHQQGQTDFPTFRGQSAETGVEKWVVDMKKMTCTYYDRKGAVMLEEKIPVV